MFATLLGALPRPDGDAADIDGLVRAAIRAQEDAGLEPITDGRLRGALADRAAVVAAWRFAASATDRAVKQSLPGPYSIGRHAADRDAATIGAAIATRATVLDLAAAGCPLIEIEETEAHLIGDDQVERGRFVAAHQALADGVEGVHLSLSIAGGSAWGAGIETFLEAPYASLAVDLIDGSDNWNLVTRWPGDRGVIVGALPAKASPADAKETLLWAARYAAASNGRGLDRVGIGSAGSYANLAWEVAVQKLRKLGEAASLASLPGGANLARELDPRAVSARSAAMGHDPAKGG